MKLKFFKKKTICQLLSVIFCYISVFQNEVSVFQTIQKKIQFVGILNEEIFYYIEQKNIIMPI